MRNVVIHTADKTISLYSKLPQDLKYGVGILLATSMWLQKVKEEKIVTALAFSVGYKAIGYLNLTSALDQMDDGAIAGIVEVVAWFSDFPQWFGVQVSLQHLHRYAAHIAHVDPRIQYRYSMWPAKLRQWLIYLENTNPHISILAQFVKFVELIELAGYSKLNKTQREDWKNRHG